MNIEVEAALWGAGAGAIMSVAATIIASIVLEPLKQRISEYNEVVKLLNLKFHDVDDLLSEYWQSDVVDAGLQFRCARKKTEIYATLEEINRLQNGHVDFTIAVQKFTDYFDLLMGGRFGSVNHTADLVAIDASGPYVQDCLNIIDAMKYKIRSWYIFSNRIR